MVAIKSAEAKRFLRSPSPSIFVFLLYGPDAGLIEERAETLSTFFQPEKSDMDPFLRTILSAEELAPDASRLRVEAQTFGFFGKKRLIEVKSVSSKVTDVIKELLAEQTCEAHIIVQGGDLPKSSALRAVCEQSPYAAAVACYTDTQQDLHLLIEETFRPWSTSLTAEAKALLLSLLGADRKSSRNELEKLALYTHGRPIITQQDVEESVSDVSTLILNQILDAAYEGDIRRVNATFKRLIKEGTSPDLMIRIAIRHGFMLMSSRLKKERGCSFQEIFQTLPLLHFSRKESFQRQLLLWSELKLRSALTLLHKESSRIREAPALAEPRALNVLWKIGQFARKDNLRTGSP